MSQPGPRNLLDYAAPEQMKKTVIQVGDPQISPRVPGDGIHNPPGNAVYRNKSVILQVANPAKRGDPNSPAIILKKRQQPRLWKSTNANLLHPSHSAWLARRDL